MKKIISLIIIISIVFTMPIVIANDTSFDITTVSDITAEELNKNSPNWCTLKYCKLIIELSKKYNISSEFAISVFKYEYVAERNAVGGWTKKGKYTSYDNLEESIKHWFVNMFKTYCNINSWHYKKTKGTTIYNIAPLYNQGQIIYNDLSKNWYTTIENETKLLLTNK